MRSKDKQRPSVFVAEIKLRDRKEAQRRAVDMAKLERIAEALPALDAIALHPFEAYGDGCVEYICDTREDAAAMAGVRGLEPVPVWVIRQGSVSIEPAERERIKRPLSLTAEVHYEILPVWWTYEPDANRLNPSSAYLSWYTHGLNEGGPMIHVKAWINGDPAYAVEQHQRNERGQIMAYRWGMKNDPNGEPINYSSGDPKRMGNRVRYFWSEPGNGPGLADYLSAGDEWPEGEGGGPSAAMVPDVRACWTACEPEEGTA